MEKERERDGAQEEAQSGCEAGTRREMGSENDL